jgi:predicted small lipoprotein YifL
MTLTAKILSVLLLAFALGACGQSGPLYVPGDPSSIETTPKTPESEEDRDENGEDDDSQ